MSVGQTNTLTIRTPEGIEFSFLLAGPITRFLAWSVDFMAIMAANKLLTVLLGVVGILSRDLATAASILGYFVVSIGYGITLLIECGLDVDLRSETKILQYLLYN